MADSYEPISSPTPGWPPCEWKASSPLLSQVALRIGVTTAVHPLLTAKTLIQIGHEPIAPRLTKTWYGSQALSLPSVFQYVGHIRRRDGFFGLYRGFAPRLIDMGVSAIVAEHVQAKLPNVNYEDIDEDELTIEQKWKKALQELVNIIIERAACLVVTQPLQVVSVRAMACFVGREGGYDNVFSGLASIYRENGVLGFWAGLVPRAIGELATLVVTAGAAFAVNNYVLGDKSLKLYTNHVASFVASSLFYPFAVVSNVSCVSRSGLAAGYPPNMPFYDDWTDAFRHLAQIGQLKRGSSVLFRYQPVRRRHM